MSAQISQVRETVAQMAGRRVLVIGDVVLDDYIIGRASRLSREAPIPVLDFVERRYVPGGSANPSNNITALGGRAFQLGVIGADEAGRKLAAALIEHGVDIAGLVTDPSRPTTTKMRILASGVAASAELFFPQQVARVDQIDRRLIEGETERKVLDYLRRCAPDVDAILFSDYKNGFIAQSVIALAQEIAAERADTGPILTVDAQGDLDKFAGCDVIKCNLPDAEAYLGRTISDDDFPRALSDMLAKLRARLIVITRGGDGLSLLERGGAPVHIAASNPSQIFDVTGAGDTVIAVLTLALAAHAPAATAARLAEYAAGMVIRKLGNATVNPTELIEAATKHH